LSQIDGDEASPCVMKISWSCLNLPNHGRFQIQKAN
jgi:hypothetical protein